MDLMKLYQELNEMRETHFEMLNKTTVLMNELAVVIQLIQQGQKQEEEVETEPAEQLALEE